jgi:hypothetical protein
MILEEQYIGEKQPEISELRHKSNHSTLENSLTGHSNQNTNFIKFMCKVKQRRK